MRINQTKNAQNFSGIYNNKILLKSLDYIADHGASFATGVSFVSALALRPLAINATPKTDKENFPINFIKYFMHKYPTQPDTKVPTIIDNQLYETTSLISKVING